MSTFKNAGFGNFENKNHGILTYRYHGPGPITYDTGKLAKIQDFKIDFQALKSRNRAPGPFSDCRSRRELSNAVAGIDKGGLGPELWQFSLYFQFWVKPSNWCLPTKIVSKSIHPTCKMISGLARIFLGQVMFFIETLFFSIIIDDYR